MYKADSVVDSERFIKNLSARIVTDLHNRRPAHKPGSASLFRDDYLSREMLSKLRTSASTSFTRDAGLNGFLQGEQRNIATNRRLSHSISGYVDPSDTATIDLLEYVEYYATSLIGEIFRGFGKRTVQTIVEKEAYFGPGTNQGHKGSTLDMHKKASRLTCTKELLPFALATINGDPCFASLQIAADGLASLTGADHYLCVDDSRLTTVPKNAKTDRVITVEPHINSYLQNGIGMWMRSRLAKFSPRIDLSDQSRNMDFARRASIRLDLATVDVQNASNTLSYGCVKRLFRRCPQLFQLMELTRSKRWKHGNSQPKTFAMFSGMGNGFTFPLESAVFYALAEGCRMYLLDQDCETDVDWSYIDQHCETSIYGDDIIVHNYVYPLLVKVLDYYGFTVNPDKTFGGDNPFRESCGGYFFRGSSVKPFYIRKPAFENVCDAYALHNAIWRWASQDGLHFDSIALPWLTAIQEWVKARNKSHVCYVHPDLGDVGFFPIRDLVQSIGPWSEVSKYTCYKMVGERRVIGRKFALWKLESYLRQIGSEHALDFEKMASRQSPQRLKKQRVEFSHYFFPFVVI